MPTKILIKRGSASQWSSSTTALSSGELGLDTTNNIIKVGDGSTLWNSLPGLTLTLTQVAELAQDALSTAFSNGTHSNITVTYDDNANSISLATGPDVITTTSLNNTLTDPSSGYLQIADLSNKTGSGVAELVDGDLYIPSGNIIFEGTTDNSYELTLSSPDVTSDITLNLPNSNGTLALTSDVTTAVANIVNSAPATLDTLNELATALGNDANFSTTVTNSIADKVSKSGGDTITASTASTVGLIVKGAASQTANLQEWQTSVGNKGIWVDGNGQLETGYFFTNFGGGSYKNSGLITVNPANNIVPLVIAGAASQTASLQEWRNSSGTALAKIQPDGSIRSRYFGDMNDTTPYIDFSSNKLTINSRNASYVGLVVQGFASQTADLQQWQDNAGNIKALVGSGGNAVFNGIRSGSGSTTGAINAYTTAAQIGILVQGAASQTANLQEWQNSSGSALARIKANGNTVLLGALTVNQSNTFEVGDNYGIGSFEVKGTSFMIPRAATGIGLIIRGFASQSANLQEWQNNAGTVLASIDSNGQLRTPQILNIASFNNSRLQMTNTGSLFDVGVASNVALRVRGASSQTANLQEWQDSSGTVLAKVDASGNIYPNSIISTGGNANSFGGNTIAGVILAVNTTNATGVVIKAGGAQTANLQEWQNSAGTVLAKITATGALDITPSSGDTISFRNSSGGLTLWGGNSRYYMNTELQMTGGNWAAGRLGVDTNGASNIGLVIRGAASQSANLTQWQDSGGNVLTRVQADGTISWGTGGSALQNSTGRLVVNPSSASAIAVIVKGASSQTANLQEWQNSAGTILAKVDSAGSINAVGLSLTSTVSGTMFSVDPTYGGIKSRGGAVGFSGAASLNIGTNYTGQSAIVASGFAGQSVSTVIIKSVASQTSNLTEWQDSSGTVLASVDSYGNMVSQALSTGITRVSFAGLYGASLNVIPYGTAQQGIIVRAVASQTADLQQWQNSSGTVLVKLTAEGVLDTPLITNAQAASYTLVAADSGKLVEINNASGVTLTIPTNASVSYAIGTQINILQTGTGQITIAGAGGVTVNATPGLKLRAQWSSATLIKRGTDTWVAIGDLSA